MTDLSLDLRYLHVALVVAEHGSFRRAAEDLEIPQSTVSRRVQLLEHRLGAPLFTRNFKGVRLTVEGARFLSEARLGAQHLSNAVSSMKSLRRSNGGHLRVGLFASLADGFAKRLFLEYRKRHNHVAIRLEETTSQSAISSIVDGQLDLAFVTGKPVVTSCETIKLWDEQLLLAVPSTHALAGPRRAVTWEMIEHEHFIVTGGGRGPEIEDHIVARLARPGFRPDIHVHAVGREMLLNMVALDFGVAVTTRSAAATLTADVVFLPLDEEQYIPASAIWRKTNANPALKSILRIARDFAEADNVAASRTGSISPAPSPLLQISNRAV